MVQKNPSHRIIQLKDARKTVEQNSKYWKTDYYTKLKIFIVGFMGSGKSVIGRKLATALELPFIDLDQEFENQYKLTIDNFFKKYNEELFRNLESKVLRQTALIKDAIISTGGGTPCFNDNMDFINATGTSLYMKVSAEELLNRILLSHKPRPLLHDLTVHQMLEEIKTMLIQRQKFYQQATLIVESDKIDLPGLIEIINRLRQ